MPASVPLSTRYFRFANHVARARSMNFGCPLPVPFTLSLRMVYGSGTCLGFQEFYMGRRFVCLLCASFLVSSLWGSQKLQSRMTNQDVIELVSLGFSDGV